MINIRIRYTANSKDELKQAISSIKKDFDIISCVEESKSKNPKYANSQYKMAYLDVEKKK